MNRVRGMKKLDQSFDGHTVSEATLLIYDVYSAIVEFLEKHYPAMLFIVQNEFPQMGVQHLDVKEIADDPKHWVWQTDDTGVDEGEDKNFMAWFVWEYLWTLMNDIAPDGCYFGSHPGDGALIGYWQPDEFVGEPDEDV